MKNTYLMLCAIMVFGCSISGWAQESQTASDFFFADKTIMEIQGNMINLVDENQTLQIEQSNLKRKIRNLEQQIEGFKAANAELKRTDRFQIEEEPTMIGRLRTETLQKDNSILILKSKLAQIKGALIDLEEQQRLWKMQLADLQYEKRDMEIQVNLKKSSLQENIQKEEKEVLTLKQELGNILKTGREVDEKISQTSRDILILPARLEGLIKESKQLQKEMVTVKKQESLTRREILHWENKKELAVKSAESLTWMKKRSKEELEEEVQYLEQEYEKFNMLINDAFSEKKKREELTQQFIALDQENQKLRNEIEIVKEKIEAAQ